MTIFINLSHYTVIVIDEIDKSRLSRFEDAQFLHSGFDDRNSCNKFTISINE